MKYLLLCYDISEDRLRNRLYKYLLKIGSIPIQKSVHLLPYNFYNKQVKLDWIKKEIIPLTSKRDQIHAFPFGKDNFKDMMGLKTIIDLSFLQNSEETLII